MRSATGIKSKAQFDYPYFRALWNRIVIVLLAASLLPVIVVGGVLYHFAAQALEDKEIKALEVEVLESKASIDSLLGDEIIRLRQLAAGLSSPGRVALDSEPLKTALDFLNETGGHVSGLAILDGNGRTMASAGEGIAGREGGAQMGPLNGSIDQGYYVGELFRNSDDALRFFIGISGGGGDKRSLLACMDASIFGGLAGMKKEHGERFLVGRDVIFKIGGRAGPPIGHSPAAALEKFDGIRIQEAGEAIVLKVWQGRAPWLNVFQVPRGYARQEIGRVRIIAISTLVILGLLIVGIVLLVGNNLVSRLEGNRGAIRTLDRQLRRTSYLASSMELSMGCFREVKETIFNIDSSLAVLREEPVVYDSAVLRESMDQIHAELRRAQRSVERYLRYIHPDPPLIADTDAHKLLDDLVDILERELRFRNISVRRSFSEDLPMLRTDPSKLRQVFQNIVLNAIEAVGENGKISLTTRLGEKGVAVTVADTGPGIPEPDLERIFEPLWTTRPRGTGLGLPICRDILDRLGGDITIESAPGKGTSVTIILPLRFNPSRTV